MSLLVPDLRFGSVFSLCISSVFAWCFACAAHVSRKRAQRAARVSRRASTGGASSSRLRVKPIPPSGAWPRPSLLRGSRGQGISPRRAPDGARRFDRPPPRCFRLAASAAHPPRDRGPRARPGSGSRSPSRAAVIQRGGRLRHRDRKERGARLRRAHSKLQLLNL